MRTEVSPRLGGEGKGQSGRKRKGLVLRGFGGVAGGEEKVAARTKMSREALGTRHWALGKMKREAGEAGEAGEAEEEGVGGAGARFGCSVASGAGPA